MLECTRNRSVPEPVSMLEQLARSVGFTKYRRLKKQTGQEDWREEGRVGDE
ncbi:hypothetical protein [Chlorobaculum sp. 24CR]|uniref:hypothetical protein n=1 Tax=Chlorobaculum sp. 24CR TaxID=2508878 RepID=UPI0014314D30|nr:hypothetical protein [Chlorobaculum sp. 24CR]